MARLGFDAYLDHLRSESARFRDVLAAAEPGTRVPTCPEWDAADLLWHLGEVQWFWSSIIAHRPDGPDALVEPPRPGSYEELLAFHDTSSAALTDALAAASPQEQAWSWSVEQTVGFTYRRQAHEALIHRIDAEQAAGVASAPVDPALAADGVAEAIDVMYGGKPSWGTFAPDGRHVVVECTDTGDRVVVALGRLTGTDTEGTDHDLEDISVVATLTVEAESTVRGTAAALDLWLWRRRDDSGVAVSGDRAAYDHFRIVTGQPIN